MAFYNKLNNKSNFVISFSKNPKNDFGIFAKGYFNAASKMANILLTKNHFSDYEAYPILFLYRHALELFLKNIIYKSSLILLFKGINDITPRLYNNHNLIILSEISSKILMKLFRNDKSIFDLSHKISNICFEFSEIDPNSYSYRYPIDKKGNYSTKHHQVVNLESICSELNELLDELDTLNFGLNIESDITQEIFEILEKLRD